MPLGYQCDIDHSDSDILYLASSNCWRSESPGHHGARQEEGQGAASQEEAQEPDQGQHDRRAEGGDQDQGEVQRAARHKVNL